MTQTTNEECKKAIGQIEQVQSLLNQAQKLLQDNNLTLALDTSLDDPALVVVPNIDFWDATDPEYPMANEDTGPTTSAQSIFDNAPIVLKPLTINAPDRMVLDKNIPPSWTLVSQK